MVDVQSPLRWEAHPEGGLWWASSGDGRLLEVRGSDVDGYRVRIQDPVTGEVTEDPPESFAYAGLEQAQGMAGEALRERAYSVGVGPISLNALQEPPVPWFRSQLPDAIATHPQVRATAEHWADILRGLPGIKRDELEWAGILEYLETRQGQTIDRDSLADWAVEHPVPIDVIVKQGGQAELTVEFDEGSHEIYIDDEAVEAEAADKMWEIRESLEKEHPEADGSWVAGEAARLARQESERKYTVHRWTDQHTGRYVIEQQAPDLNGEYRVFADGEPLKDRFFSFLQAEHATQGHYMEAEGIGDAINGGTRWAPHRVPGGADYTEVLLTVPFNRDMTEYRSPHWSEANVVVHLRMTKRTDERGRPVMFVEEIQSDWHTALRRKKENTPSAPFRRHHVDLALKAALRLAAADGCEALAWTPGRVQAALNGKYRQPDEVSWKTSSGSLVRVFSVSGPNGPIATGCGEEVPGTEGDTLADHFGADVASRILDRQAEIDTYLEAGWEPPEARVETPGLEVWPQGYRELYDRRIPRFLKAFGKVWNVTPETVRVSVDADPETASASEDLFERVDAIGGPDTVERGLPCQALPVTKAMRRHLLEMPQPLYSVGRQWDNPDGLDEAIRNRGAVYFPNSSGPLAPGLWRPIWAQPNPAMRAFFENREKAVQGLDDGTYEALCRKLKVKPYGRGGKDSGRSGLARLFANSPPDLEQAYAQVTGGDLNLKLAHVERPSPGERQLAARAIFDDGRAFEKALDMMADPDQVGDESVRAAEAQPQTAAAIRAAADPEERFRLYADAVAPLREPENPQPGGEIPAWASFHVVNPVGHIRWATEMAPSEIARYPDLMVRIEKAYGLPFEQAYGAMLVHMHERALTAANRPSFQQVRLDLGEETKDLKPFDRKLGLFLEADADTITLAFPDGEHRRFSRSQIIGARSPGRVPLALRKLYAPEVVERDEWTRDEYLRRGRLAFAHVPDPLSLEGPDARRARLAERHIDSVLDAIRKGRDVEPGIRAEALGTAAIGESVRVEVIGERRMDGKNRNGRQGTVEGEGVSGWWYVHLDKRPRERTEKVELFDARHLLVLDDHSPEQSSPLPLDASAHEAEDPQDAAVLFDVGARNRSSVDSQGLSLSGHRLNSNVWRTVERAAARGAGYRYGRRPQVLDMLKRGRDALHAVLGGKDHDQLETSSLSVFLDAARQPLASRAHLLNEARRATATDGLRAQTLRDDLERQSAPVRKALAFIDEMADRLGLSLGEPDLVPARAAAFSIGGLGGGVGGTGSFEDWFRGSVVVGPFGDPLTVFQRVGGPGLSVRFAGPATAMGGVQPHETVFFCSDDAGHAAHADVGPSESIGDFRGAFGIRSPANDAPAPPAAPDPAAEVQPVYLALVNPLLVGPPENIRKETIASARRRGHDGLIAEAGRGIREFIAFNPDQIRSVDEPDRPLYALGRDDWGLERLLDDALPDGVHAELAVAPRPDMSDDVVFRDAKGVRLGATLPRGEAGGVQPQLPVSLEITEDGYRLIEHDHEDGYRHRVIASFREDDVEEAVACTVAAIEAAGDRRFSLGTTTIEKEAGMAGNDEPKTIVTDSDFHAVLVFPKEGVAKLLEHLRASERHGAAWDHLTDPAFLRPGETMPDHGWADGGQIDNARIPPHLKLVKDDGIYLMSSGLPPLMADGSIGDEGQLGRRFVVYAEGYDPASNPNCWDDSRDAVGGDDFSTLLEPEWAEHALARGEDLQIGATPDHFALLDAPGEGSKYSIGRDGTGGRSTEPRDVVAGDPRSIAEAMQLFLPEGVKAQAAKNGISFSQDNALLPVSIAFLDEAYALKRLGKPEFRIGHGEEVKLIDRTVKAAAEAVGFDPARYSTGQKRSGHRGGPDSAPTGPEPRPEEHRPEPYAALRSVLEERLPAGVSAHFVPAEDPSVDDAFTFRKDGKDLPYGVQIGEGSLALHRDHVNGKGDLVSITDLGMFEPGEERRLAARLGVALAQHLKVPQEIQTPPVKPASVPATERTTGKTTAKQAAKRNRKSRGVEM